MEKKPPVDIYKALKRNNFITLTACIVAGIVVLLSTQEKVKYEKDVLNYTFNKILKIDGSTGQVQNVSIADRSKTIDIEIKDHIDQWTMSYYDFTSSNVQRKTAEAKFLITKVDYDTLQARYKTWHEEVRRQKYTQSAALDPDSVFVTGTQEPYDFTAVATIVVSDGFNQNKYRLKTTGQVIMVDPDWPHNRHGMVIRNYREISTRKIQ